jgi:hypothetical protein
MPIGGRLELLAVIGEQKMHFNRRIRADPDISCMFPVSA